MLPRLDLVDLFLRFSPRLDVLFRPVDMAFGICNLNGHVSPGYTTEEVTIDTIYRFRSSSFSV